MEINILSLHPNDIKLLLFFGSNCSSENHFKTNHHPCSVIPSETVSYYYHYY